MNIMYLLSICIFYCDFYFVFFNFSLCSFQEAGSVVGLVMVNHCKPGKCYKIKQLTLKQKTFHQNIRDSGIYYLNRKTLIPKSKCLCLQCTLFQVSTYSRSTATIISTVLITKKHRNRARMSSPRVNMELADVLLIMPLILMLLFIPILLYS